MSEQSVKEYLKQYNMDSKIITLPNSTATVTLAAQALCCEEARIAKTLSFELTGKYILNVAAGDTKIDNTKYKAELGEKAKMIPFEEVEEKIGHPIGGVCPFAVKDNVGIYLD